MLHLPSYAPEYNPDEYLNSDLKNSVDSKPQTRNLDEIQTATEEFLAFLSAKPEHVAANFEYGKVVENQEGRKASGRGYSRINHIKKAESA